MAYKKINKKFKNLWINGLRSGNYTQTQGLLKYENSFCCLGVACDVYSRKISKKIPEWGAYPYESTTKFDSVASFINPLLQQKIGLSKAAMEKLANMNDTENKSFAEIANWIEKNL